MRVLFVSVEVAPFAKVGGLADVVGSLPKALRSQGHDVRIVMPDYGMIQRGGHNPIKPLLGQLPIEINSNWHVLADVRETSHDGVPVYLVSGDGYFKSVDRSEAIYTPGIDQYLFFSVATLQMLEPLGWMPDVIHCHDWHTGLVPVLMRERFRSEFSETAAVFTIHNLAYQGEFDLDVLDKVQLSRGLFNVHQVEAWGRVNFLKAGAAFSNRVNTVSPTYAKEILSPSFGANLDGFTRSLDDRGRLWGILNGIDLEMFDPAADPDLPAHFSADDMTGKAACKSALLEELRLDPIEGAPLLGVVSRMSSQKGMDLIAEAAEALFDIPVQLVILGAGEPHVVEALTRLGREFPNHLRYIDGFNLALGARIYGACDGFLMPSAFEPCGLGQMIARRYGALPLVRATGGLADTVTEGVDGFVFHQRSREEFVDAVKRLAAAYRKPKSWGKLVHRVMTMDESWRKSAIEYERMYIEAQTDERSAKLQTA
ncbi:MAG TPA: glycogen synthase [Fimbriimonadaceae bacterium]|nr:glycogen synthase [Fimbriimonadaceae bacterium]